MMLAQYVKRLRWLLWTLAFYLPYPLAFAQSADDLDDITIRVIGLDEIPRTTIQVIDFPEPDLGEMSNIQEGVTRQITDLIQDSNDLGGVESVGGGPPTDTTTPPR